MEAVLRCFALVAIPKQDPSFFKFDSRELPCQQSGSASEECLDARVITEGMVTLVVAEVVQGIESNTAPTPD
jgi:hypothetical protein